MVYPVGPVRFGRPPFLPPQELRVLPFNALRTSLPTRNPRTASEALEAALQNAATPAYAPPILMPAHMVQSRWKRGRGGQTRGALKPAGASGRSFAATIAHEDARRARLAPILHPVETMSAQRFVDQVGANRLAQIPGTLPVSGRARTRPASISSPPDYLTAAFDLRAFVREQERAAVVATHKRSVRQAQRVVFGARVRKATR